MLDYNTTGDGLVSAIVLSSIVKESGKTLSELSKVIKILPQSLFNAKLADKDKKDIWQTDEEIVSLIEETKTALSGSGRVLIRPSGTEPLIRVMIEGSDQEMIDSYCRRIAELIESKAR